MKATTLPLPQSALGWPLIYQFLVPSLLPVPRRDHGVGGSSAGGGTALHRSHFHPSHALAQETPAYLKLVDWGNAREADEERTSAPELGDGHVLTLERFERLERKNKRKEEGKDGSTGVPLNTFKVQQSLKCALLFSPPLRCVSHLPSLVLLFHQPL